jgi:hypothetical protein
MNFESAEMMSDAKVITCILPAGTASDLVDELFHEKGLNTSNVSRARGASQRSGDFADEEEVLTVVVSKEQADDVFQFLYERCEIGIKAHRFMFQTGLTLATLFTLPDVEEEPQG